MCFFPLVAGLRLGPPHLLRDFEARPTARKGAELAKQRVHEMAAEKKAMGDGMWWVMMGEIRSGMVEIGHGVVAQNVSDADY